MIETKNRRVAHSTRDNTDQWLSDLAADLAGESNDRDVYAERREINAYGAAGVLRSREANMTDRYDRDGHELRDIHPETLSKRAQASHAQAYEDDYYEDYQDSAAAQTKAYVFDDVREEQGPEWTYDEKREIWVDRDGNPYVETYAEGEEDRYAPADDEYAGPRPDIRLPRRKSGGGAVSLAALVLVVCIGGGLAYAWKKGGFIGSELPGIGSAPPVIKASNDPVKIKPAETVAASDQPTREIFNRNNQAAPPASERLVRHEEQPVAVLPVRTEGVSTNVTTAPTAVPDASATRPVTTSNITLPAGDGAPAADQTAVASNGTDGSTGEAPSEPRRVRTIKVLPDNSVVTGDAPITGQDAAPTPSRSVDVATIAPASSQAADTAPATDAVPQLPPAASQSTTAQPTADPTQVATAPVTTVPATPVTSVPAAATPPAADTSADDNANATTVVEPTRTETAVPPAVPPVRPRNIPTKPAQVIPAKPTQVASAEPAMTTAASNGSYVVQVSSQRSPADAQAAFQSLQRKYADVLGSMKPSFRKVDLPDRGTYYRVRVGSWASSTEALAFCAKLKAAGGDCVIARN